MEIKISFQKSNERILEIKKSFAKANEQIVEMIKRTNFGNQKSFQKSNRQILEIKKIVSEIKETVKESKEMIILVTLLEHRRKHHLGYKRSLLSILLDRILL